MSVLIPALLTKLSTKADKSIKIEFATREFRGDEIAELLKYRDQEGWLQFNENGEEMTAPTEKAESGLGEGKSPGQRQRAALYVMWEKNGKPTDTFEEYYRVQMERILDQIKAKIPE